MTTRMSYYSAKFDSAQDEVVWTKSRDQSWVDEEVGDCDQYGMHYARINNLYGKDWIVGTDSQGRVEVESFKAGGQITVTHSSECDKRWDEIVEAWSNWNAEMEQEDFDA